AGRRRTGRVDASWPRRLEPARDDYEILMKNTKHQTPDTKQISNTKYPRSHEGNGDSTTGWVLHDEAVEREKGKQRHPFDFEERTAMFGEKIVRFAKRIPRGPINDRLISQIVGAGTS